MALVLKDRVLENSTSSGTGSFTLSGAQTGYQSFSAIGNGNTTYYTIQGKNSDGTLTGEWEVGVGTWSTGNTLSRDTVLESSNSNALVNFAVGLKDVFCDLPAEYALSGTGTVTSITAGTGLSGGTITTSGTIAIDSTVATLTGTQTLTNKTLTAPKIDLINDTNGNEILGFSPTTSATDYFVVKNGIGVGAPIHLYADGSSTNTGMHIQPKGTGLVTISDGTDFNKGIRFRSSSSSASAITLLDAVSTAGRVITLPDATTTLVGRNTTDTLTNKSISGTTNTLSNIGNSSLTNSSITINGTAISLGGTVTTGTVTSVTGTAPVVSSGGTTPAISMAAATTSVSGYLTSTDWTTFNGKYSVGGALGTPSSGTLTNCTGLPVGGISATGTPSSTTYLRGDGTWSTVSGGGSGTVTSVAMTVPSFLSVSGSPITTSGTLAVSLSGTALPVANGGTGQTTASAAFNALSPITTTGDLIIGNGTNSATRLAIGANSYVLTSNGTTATWAAASGGGGSPGGSNTQLQYNNAGAFGGVSTLTFNGTTVSSSNDMSIYGITVGRGAGSVSSNTVVGANALVSNTTGSSNTAIGQYALNGNTTGVFNTVIGRYANFSSTTGSNNIVIGAFAAPSSTTVSNEVTIGTSSTTSNRFWGELQFANSAGTSGQVLTSSGSGASPTWTTVGGGGSSTITVDTKTASYTVVAGDAGKVINCSLIYPSSDITISLTAAATLGAGFNCTIWNSSDSDYSVTIDPNGSETIEGNATLILRASEGTQIICNGTNWYTGNKKTMKLYAESVYNGYYRPPEATGSYYPLAIGERARATSSQTIAIGRNCQANGDSSIALGSDTNASAANGAAIARGSGGTAAITATGSGAIALGGSYASGTDSFATNITNNTSSYGATGNNSIAMGLNAKATSGRDIALGWNCIASGGPSFATGYSSTASGSYSIAMGNTATASGYGSVALSSTGFIYGAQATSSNSFAFGSGASSTTEGKFAFSPTDLVGGGNFVVGNQCGLYIAKGDTTDATAYILRTDGGNSAASASNQINLPTNSAYSFTGTVVARQKAANGTASAAWKIEGLIRKEGTDASTTLVASTVTAISNVPGWTLALSADTTNGALAITATGAASTNIRWVATVQTSEVIYA